MQYGVLVFRHAELDDAHHVAFAAQFGELDDIKPYIAMGRKNRLPFDELFDVSNLEDDGSLVKIGSKREHMGLVRLHGKKNVSSSMIKRPLGELHLPRRLELQPTTGGIQPIAGT